MVENIQKKGRGGRREGAGRPGTNSKLYTFRAPETMASFIDAQDNKTDFIKGCIAQAMLAERHPDLKRLGTVYDLSQMNGFTLPFFDIGVAAGFPIPLDNDERAQSIELIKMLCPDPDSCYLIRVEGNSMIDAGINSGDLIIVDKSNRNPTETQVAVCEFNGEYTLKRFVKRDGEGWMIPANPDYPEIRVTPNDQFCVWGTVTYIIHKPRG